MRVFSAALCALVVAGTSIAAAEAQAPSELSTDISARSGGLGGGGFRGGHSGGMRSFSGGGMRSFHGGGAHSFHGGGVRSFSGGTVRSFPGVRSIHSTRSFPGVRSFGAPVRYSSGAGHVTRAGFAPRSFHHAGIHRAGVHHARFHHRRHLHRAAFIGGLSALWLGSGYYYPASYANGPYCAGYDGNGCVLRWADVPVGGGYYENRCVAYCPY